MKYFLISLGVVLLIIFGIVILNRGGSKPAPVSVKTVKLADFKTNTNANVQMITEGSIVANENYRSIQILISPTSRTVNIYTGYQGQVLNTQTLANNGPAYEQFLAALNRAAYTTERRTANGVNSNAVCPTGTRTHYLITDGGKNVMDHWTASCTLGTFGGNVSLTNTLFQTQIPNYSSLTSSVSL